MSDCFTTRCRRSRKYDQGARHNNNGGSRLKIQAKLSINSEHDPAERAADLAAERVMSNAPQHARDFRNFPESLYRSGATSGPGLETDSKTEEQIQAERSRGGGVLPRAERTFFEQRFGVDFSQVRIHSNKVAALLTRKLNARAFAVGNNVFFGKEEYRPGTREGRKLMAHELAHTVQQKGGKNSGPETVSRVKFLYAWVHNDSPRDVFVKPETGSVPVRVRAGGLHWSRIDGLATMLHGNQVYKVPSLMQAWVKPNGDVEMNLTGELLPVDKGWKNRQWVQGHPDWMPLLNAAATI